MRSKIYWVWLNQIEGLGPVKIKRLINYFKTPKKIWQANKKELKKLKGIGEKTSKKILLSKSNFKPEVEMKKVKKSKLKLVTLKDKCYPNLLKEIYDAPSILYYKGDLKALNKPSLAIVGTRECSDYAKKVAYRLGYRLAKAGIPIVSGMALGVDTAAHKGALETGLTYAVLGSGLDYIYPYQNRELYSKIINNGAVVSSFYLGSKPEKKNFPCRNRIISGLAMGTIVVEAPKRSGALITADFALEQGREVYAIPGDITRKNNYGSNKLIQQGAKLVQNISDIIEEIKLNFLNRNKNLFFKRKKEVITKLSKTERKVYNLIKTKKLHYEEISQQLDLDVTKLNRILVELELKNIINKDLKNNFSIIK